MLRAEEPEMVDTPLPKIHASILVPKGWNLTEQESEGVLTYTISREKLKSPDDSPAAGLVLQVTPKVKERTEMTPSDYASDLLSGMKDDDATIEKSEEGPFKDFQTTYTTEGEEGTSRVLCLAKGNDKSGTLYFLSWHTPQAEAAKLDPIREKIFAALKFDPTF